MRIVGCGLVVIAQWISAFLARLRVCFMSYWLVCFKGLRTFGFNGLDVFWVFLACECCCLFQFLWIVCFSWLWFVLADCGLGRVRFEDV